MRQVPARCVRCSEPNIHNLDYCAVCGVRFETIKAPQVPTGKKGGLTAEQKLKAKRLKKRKELTELFKNEKISAKQYSAGLRKLGYSTDADKAMAFKKYIREQIKAFEQMKVDPNAVEGASYYDPNESRTDLPRDEFGNVITDFSVGQSRRKTRPTEDVPVVDHGAYIQGRGKEVSSGPRFGSSLFGERSPKREERISRGPREIPKMDQNVPRRRNGPRRIRASAVWDDEDEEEEEDGDPHENEDDFEIDLDEDLKGESGWWDEEDWELEWTDEDEDEIGEYQLEWEEEDEWELDLDEEEGGEEEEDPGHKIELDTEKKRSGSYEIAFEDDDLEEEEPEDRDLDQNDDDEYLEEEEEVVDEDEDDDDWSIPQRRRIRGRNR